jgi:hypothetical protein
MKKVIKNISVVFLLMATINTTAQTDGGTGPMIDNNINMRIDSLGMGHCDYTMKFNASIWQAMNQYMGNNPALLKKALEDEMPAAFISDYQFSKNDFERSFNFKFNVVGMGKTDKNGKWSFDLDSKDPRTEKLADNKFLNVTTEDFGGIPANQRQVIELPAIAKNATIESNAQGKKSITCTMPFANSGGSAGGIMKYIKLIGGGALALAGLVLLLVPANKNRNQLKVVEAQEKVA